MNRQWIRDFSAVRFLQGSRAAILRRAAVLIAVIAIIDWYFENNISFGFLYLFPMLMVGGCLPLLPTAGIAALCTGLTEAFDPFPWALSEGISRVVLSFAAFFGAGFFGFAAARTRRMADQHLAEVERDVEQRRRTEEQLDFLIANSPAAIFTLDSSGLVQLANRAAHQLLGIENGSLQGQAIGRFFPALATVPPSNEAPFFHTEMECQGWRQDDRMFMAHVWFSTYQTMSGPRLAAVVFDTSEELRDRAEFSLQQILTGSKVLVGAMCHEIRNMCGAIGVIYSKLTRDEKLAANEDFNALGSLVQGLEKMAGLELRQTTRLVAENVNLNSVLEELRIVIDASFQESGITVCWEQASSLARVCADHQALLQIFLNIAKNSQRALEGRPRAEFIVRTESRQDSTVVRFIDNGPGVAYPEGLFAPFQPGAQASGLGLYLSRTFARAFQGDIEYQPQAEGSCFAVILKPAGIQPSVRSES
jgi:nitrogen-specific signal transduction histidine kinase